MLTNPSTLSQTADAGIPALVVSEMATQNEILKYGLELQAKFNTMCAFEHLKFRGVNLNIIAKTLFAAIGPHKEEFH